MPEFCNKNFEMVLNCQVLLEKKKKKNFYYVTTTKHANFVCNHALGHNMPVCSKGYTWHVAKNWHNTFFLQSLTGKFRTLTLVGPAKR